MKLYCSYCGQAFERDMGKVFCKPSHKVNYHRGFGAASTRPPKDIVEGPKSLPSVDNPDSPGEPYKDELEKAELERKEKLWREYPELRPKIIRPI